jgi:predicted transcriptional regulator of viral defense system
MDAAPVYAHPRTQLARLERAGLLQRLATGYFVVVPQDRIGLPWRPDLETAAAAIAATAVGADAAVVMGVSAARMHRAIPRALAVALVAVPERRHPVQLRDRDDATVQFVQRDPTLLDAERLITDLGGCLVTTVEQTVLDLAHRPTLGYAEPDALAATAAS